MWHTDSEGVGMAGSFIQVDRATKVFERAGVTAFDQLSLDIEDCPVA